MGGRAASDVAMTAKDKAMEVNRKHDIVNRSKENVEGVVNNVRASDKHNILGKIGEAVQQVVQSVGEFIIKLAGGMKKKEEGKGVRGDSLDETFVKVPQVSEEN